MSYTYMVFSSLAALGGLFLWLVLGAIGRRKEWDHHGYYGIVLMLLPYWGLQLLGTVLLFDDIRQHTIQSLDLAEGRHPRPDFTLIHRIGQWILWTPPRPPLAWIWA